MVFSNVINNKFEIGLVPRTLHKNACDRETNESQYIGNQKGRQAGL